MKSFSIAATAAVTLASLAAPLQADVLSFQEDLQPAAGYQHDGVHVRNDGTNGANNYDGGTNSRFLVGRTAGTAGDGVAFRGLLGYSLSDIPAGATITSVTLTVKLGEDDVSGGGSVAGDYAVELRSIGGSFTEGTATWNNTFGDSSVTLGTMLSTVTMASRGGAANTPYTFGSTAALVAAVQAAVDGTDVFQFSLVAPTVEAGASRVLFRIASDDASNSTLREHQPVLTIEYTPIPEPASLALLALGGVFVAGRRR